ncbi:MAG TPA: A24 family peptidase [Blastocatellia bacterium]|nr:A24 family peptidase [Blastocatellia bacterium]
MIESYQQFTAAVLTLFVVAVSIFDLRERRIPNAFVFPATLIGLVGNSIWYSWAGLVFGLKGLGLAFLLLFIPYLTGGMKAGDVKFLMAIGAFTGATDVFHALLATLLCYPLFAVVAVVREGKLQVTWLRFRRVFWNFLGFFVPSLKLYAMRLEAQDDSRISSVKTPFGVAIATGTLIVIYTNLLP